MTDETGKAAEGDAARISIDRPSERRKWSEKFGVTEHRLCEAVAAVGANVDDVERYLNR